MPLQQQHHHHQPQQEDFQTENTHLDTPHHLDSRYSVLCQVIYGIEIVINGLCLCNMDPPCKLISRAKSGVLDHKL